MRRGKLFAAVGVVIAGGLLGTTAAVAQGADTAAPAAVSVTAYMEDQTCLNGDTVQVALTAVARGTDRPFMYRWDFTNDGTFDTNLSRRPRVLRTYGDEVNVTARVEVRNAAQETATDTVRFGTLNCSN